MYAGYMIENSNTLNGAIRYSDINYERSYNLVLEYKEIWRGEHWHRALSMNGEQVYGGPTWRSW